MTRELALKAANLLTAIEFCDDVIAEVQNVKVKLEITDSKICDILQLTEGAIVSYKNKLEHKLEAL